MGFELPIAAKRDPTDVGKPPPLNRGSLLPKTLAFHASGAFSHDDGAALARAIDDALAPEFCAYIVCLEAVDNIDESALVTFAQRIRGRRDEGIDLRLCAVEPHVHRLLEDVGEAGDALMPLDKANDTTPRRRVDLHPTHRRRRPKTTPDMAGRRILFEDASGCYDRRLTPGSCFCQCGWAWLWNAKRNMIVVQMLGVTERG